MSNINFGKKKKKEPLELVKLVTIASRLSDELVNSLSDVLVPDDVKIVAVHIGEFLTDKYKVEEKEN